MENKKNSVYKLTELSCLRKIEVEYWNTLEKNLQEGQFEKINFKPLHKLYKSVNNALMKLITQTTEELAMLADSTLAVQGLSAPIEVPVSEAVTQPMDEVEGYVVVNNA